ncbi:MAG: hypothetical protein AMXMBFR13_03040 [Phycisphaerae bacterium]
MRKRNALSFVAAVCALGLVATAANAAQRTFTASLDGAQVFGGVATPGTGSATLMFDDVTGDYTLTGTFQDLIGTTTNAHVHGPDPIGGDGAGVMFGITFDAGVTSGNISGAGTMSPTHLQIVLDREAYINIHTSHRPGGEIRGQLLPEPSSLGLLAVGSVALLRRRRRRVG